MTILVFWIMDVCIDECVLVFNWVVWLNLCLICIDFRFNDEFMICMFWMLNGFSDSFESFSLVHV